jgi:plastocyanin
MNARISALRRSVILSLTLLVGVILAACSSGTSTDGGASGAAGGSAAAGGGTVAVTDGTVEISAANLEFDAQVIQAPAGEAFTVSFSNEDSAPHNWSLYTEEGGEAIVQGDVIDGGTSTEIEVEALEPGEYFFVCDVHPDMTGSVVVEG